MIDQEETHNERPNPRQNEKQAKNCPAQPVAQPHKNGVLYIDRAKVLPFLWRDVADELGWQ
eukprot:3116835-Amphidinium_carterae.1